ncbi:MAG: thiolase family protein, partial [Nakamurella sp.]
VPAEVVDEVILGAANQAGEDNRDVARMAVLLAGLPDTVPGFTVNRLCASGLTAVAVAASAVRSGATEVVVAGGVESMTRAPWVIEKPGTPWARPGQLFDTSLGWRFTNPRFAAHDDGLAGSGPSERKITLTMGETAEEVAALDGITRQDSDAFSFRSHQRALAAIEAGRFAEEIVVVDTAEGTASVDEGPRAGTSMDKLGALRTIFRSDGIVTAGSSSPLTDGASALLVVSEDALHRYGLTPRARVVASASAGVAPNVMGLGPVPATEKALSRAGWGIDDVEAVELNEAFAAQSLAVMRRLHLDEAIVNADGGAIALGHPLGSSGSRLVVTLLGRLERGDLRRGLATLCVGVGQGMSLLIERP